jgi:DHA1 family bicyclomycin/chloramphenicol resistance-like MFS transporter
LYNLEKNAKMTERFRKIGFVIFLACLSAFPPFSTDMYLSSMPVIQKTFHTSEWMVQLTLSVFFLVFAVLQLVWGPLSDRYGRKPIIYLGMGIYFIGSVLCSVATNIHILIIARAIQAAGACSGMVVSLAMVRDCFKGPMMVKMLAIVSSVMMVAPMVAPVVGSFLLTAFSWQANFYFLAIYALLLLLMTPLIAETHPCEVRKPLPFKSILSAYMAQLFHWPFFVIVIAIAANFSTMFSFISSAAFIYMGTYHVSPRLFGFFFAFNASALILGNMSVHMLVARMRRVNISQLGLFLSLFGAAVMFVAERLFPGSLLSVALPMFISTYGIGLVTPTLTGLALEHVVAHTGLSASLIGVFRFSAAGVVASLMGLASRDVARYLSLMMLALVSCALLFLFVYRRLCSAST